MDMHDVRQIDGNLDADGLSAGSGSGGLLPAVLFLLAVGAWLYMSWWSILLVGHGIITAKLYPPILTSEYVFLFAAALQVVNSAFALVTPMMFARAAYAISWPFVFAIVLAIVLFEGYHGILGMNKASSAPALKAAVDATVAELDARTRNLAEQLVNTYRKKKEAYLTLTKNALQGEDGTNDRRCGDICKGNFEKYRVATGEFSHLDQHPFEMVELGPQVDARDRMDVLIGRIRPLRGAAADIARLFEILDASKPPATLAEGIEQAAEDIAKLHDRFGRLSNISEYTLALYLTNSAFSDIAHGRLPAPEARLPLVYGLLPGLSILVLSIYIKSSLGAMGRRSIGTGRLLAELTAEAFARPVLKKLLALRSENFLLALKAQYKRWRHSPWTAPQE